eukprot:gnl/Hemi2/3029_TR1071_c0_g1_i1.p1 gnl/Hemi2/3029_TR1071_c0_g1~~gnl/Hemi2/3029_TR1071_c0_g1_i1.p1  ORF type:complete len:241 (-),score=132.29 gnl/Hemi2/3029_TR1071_c0_g1_i1:127-849(-)
MASNTYCIEYAKTGRSSCKNKKCEAKAIGADELRIGKMTANPFGDGDGSMTAWHHAACWFAVQKNMKSSSKKVEGEDDLEGFDTLNASDKKLIRGLIEGKAPAKAKAAKSAGKKRKGKAAADSDDEEEEDEEEEEEEPPKKKAKKAAPKAKAAAAAPAAGKKSGGGKPLAGKVICMTGTMSISRAQMEAKLIAAGATIAKTVTNSCTHLLSARDDTDKAAAAKAKGVAVVNEAWLDRQLA